MAAEIVDAVKALATAEKKSCVQCGNEYSEETNGEGHCSFHTERSCAACCGQAEPCQRKKHCSKHHCDYPYEKFFERSAAILNYVDTRDMWASIEENDLGGGSTQKASVGQLLRWKSRGVLIKDQNLLVVRVGASIWPGSSYFFHVFTESDLDEIGKAGNTALFKSSEKSDEYSKADWIIKDQMVAGILLECKAASNDKATIEKVTFTSFPLTKTAHEVVQRGGICEAKPATPYQLPEPSANTDKLVDLTTVQQRKARDDFHSLDSITKKGLLTLDAAEPFKCNQNTVDVGFDRFQFHVGVTNAGATPAMLMSLNVEFKLLNDAEWQQLPNDACDWRRTHGANPLPMAAAPASRVSVSGELRVPHVFGENGAKAAADHRPAFYRSYVARHRPIRFRFTFAAAKGAVSRVFEYVEPVDRFKYETANDKDALFLFLDDDNLIHRRYLHVTAEEDPYGYGNLLKLDGTEFKKLDAQKVVFQALQDGKCEVQLEKYCKSKDNVDKRFFALVDTECQAVYAIKAQLIDTLSGAAKQGYAPVRFYGDEDATPKATKPATETVDLPALSAELETFVFDDKDQGLDDLSEDDLKFDGADDDDDESGSGGGGGKVNLKRVEAKLDKLNENVERLAVSLEKLVEIMAAKK